MKSIAALLLALAAFTGSLGTSSVSRCAMAVARCEARPCCQKNAATGPTLKPHLACCDVAKTTSASASPATLETSALVTTLPAVVATATPVVALVSFTPAVAPRPRGPPLYLRNRSLLL